MNWQYNPVVRHKQHFQVGWVFDAPQASTNKRDSCAREWLNSAELHLYWLENGLLRADGSLHAHGCP